MTVTINGSGTIGGISVGGLNDNIITKNEMATGGAWAPAGTVLQVVQGSYATVTTNSSSTYADTGLSASITPTSINSKILALVTLQGSGKDSSNTTLQLRLVRDATVISTFTTATIGYNAVSQSNYVGSNAYNYLDSPATSSLTTYKVQFSSGNNSSFVAVQNAGSTSTITLMEIAA